MKVLFLTNMPAYHQMELAGEFARILGPDNFRLGIYSPLSDERRSMNWQDNYQADYLLRYGASEQDRSTIEEWIQNADVVIQGRYPIKYLRARIKNGGLTYAYQERLWKRKFTLGRLIRRLPHLYRNYWSVNMRNYHLLAAGAYAGQDLYKLGLFKNRRWKFGYFINSKPEEPTAKPHKSDTTPISIVWCARMIPCKQAHKAIEMAAGLKNGGVNFHLTMIGDGELFEQTQSLVRQHELSESVSLVGSKSVAEVNAIMADSDLMLMTSDHREGWGLVINEAINNRCMPVVNEGAGAAKWLVSDGVDGIVYKDSNFDDTIARLVELCKDKPELNRRGDLAYASLTNNWSTQVAAARLCELSSLLLDKNLSLDACQTRFTDGPCSQV